MYMDNSHKFVAVLNERVPLPHLLNALAHMAAGLVAAAQQVDEVEQMRFLRYLDANGDAFPAISTYPFIILAARNSSQLRALRQAARAAYLPSTAFVDTMLGSSAADQLDKTRSTPEADLTYFGVLVFGPVGTLTPLTRKFSLFKGVSSDSPS